MMETTGILLALGLGVSWAAIAGMASYYLLVVRKEMADYAAAQQKLREEIAEIRGASKAHAEMFDGIRRVLKKKRDQSQIEMAAEKADELNPPVHSGAVPPPGAMFGIGLQKDGGM